MIKSYFSQTILAIVMVLVISPELFAQTRALPNRNIQAVTTPSTQQSPKINWDYFNDFQDTTALNNMVHENVDGNNDHESILLGLGLNFFDDAWLLLHFTNEPNYWAASNSYFDTTEAADRWLITPPIFVNNWSSLAWKALSVNLGGTPTSEDYEIYVSDSLILSSADVSGAPFYSVNEEANTWTEHVLDISDFYGDTIQIAIRHTSLSQGILAIDDLRVGYIHEPEGGMLGDFENVTAFSTDLSPWITLDLDSSVTYVLEGVSYPGSGDPASFIPFNPDLTDPSVSGIDVYEGDQFGVVFSAVAGPFGNAPNNDWLISPKATIDPGGKVSFYAKSFSHLWGLERFRVGVTTSDPEADNFTIITPGNYVQVDTAWTYFEYDLSLWANQDVHVGINCVSDTAFIFCIDDIRIDSLGTVSTPGFELEEMEVFPNPSTGMVYLNRIEQAQVRILDLMGREHYFMHSASYKNRIDLSHLPAGLYIIQVMRGSDRISRKIQLIR